MTHAEMCTPWEEHMERLVARKRDAATPPDQDTESEYRHVIYNSPEVKRHD